MEIEHMNLIMLNKNFLSDVGLRMLIYVQIALKYGGNQEKRIVHISRRRACKRLSISMGACRSAVRQLVEYGFIKMCDSKGNLVEDLSSNFVFINSKENINHQKVRTILDLINKRTSTDTESTDGPSDGGLFDDLFGK